nr:acetylornithine deacetylase [uncultured Marinobacter sp.]
MKRLLTWLVLLVLVGFGVFKAGVWWLADQRLAEARLALDEYGVFERGAIGSGIEGRLVLSGASWQDFRLTRPLEIGRLEFDAGSPLNLLTVLIAPSRVPARWSLQASRLGLTLEATMFRNWVTAGGDTGTGDPALLALACAPDPRQQISSGDLMRMGITELTGELQLQQEPGGLQGEINTAGTGSLEFNWPGVQLDPVDLSELTAGTFEPMNLTVRDGGLMRRVAAYCSRESGMEPPAWAGRAVAALRDGLAARGLMASEQLLALVRQWLLEGGELTVAVRPGAPAWGIPVWEPEATGGDDWRVEYNGARVPGVYLKKVLPVVQAAPDAAVEPVVAGAGEMKVAWHPLALEDAGQWLDYRVRVTLSNDNVVTGRLVSVSDRELEVARVVAGGEVAYPMLVRAITGLEVWRRGRQE